MVWAHSSPLTALQLSTGSVFKKRRSAQTSVLKGLIRMRKLATLSPIVLLHRPGMTLGERKTRRADSQQLRPPLRVEILLGNAHLNS